MSHNQMICLRKTSRKFLKGELQFLCCLLPSRSSCLPGSSSQWGIGRIFKEITSKMAQRRHLREILGQTYEEKGRRRTCEQSCEGIDDEAGNMSNHRRTSCFRCSDVRNQRTYTETTSPIHFSTTELSSYHSIWPSEWHDATSTSTSSYTFSHRSKSTPTSRSHSTNPFSTSTYSHGEFCHPQSSKFYDHTARDVYSAPKRRSSKQPTWYRPK